MQLKTLFQSIRTLYTRVTRDNLLREASALTYQSFLAIVPLLAVFFGIAKGFGLDMTLENWLRDELVDHQEMLSYFLQFSKTTLREASGGVIAGIGIVFLLLTTIRLLAAVEGTLTRMWGFDQGRSLWRRVSDYFALILTCPILLTVSSSATIFVTAKLTLLTESISSAGPFSSLLIALFPFVTSSILFSLVLFTMPCAPIRFRTAILSGAITAVSFQVVQTWYIFFQLRLTKISAIYGSFVAVPLFLVWLWISWLLLLIAGEIAVFIQEKGWRPSCLLFTDSPLERVQVDTAILSSAVRHFQEERPISISELLMTLPLPIKALSSSIARLQKRGLLHISDHSTASALLIPNKKTSSYALSDLVLPDMHATSLPEGEMKTTVERTIRKWRSELKKESVTLQALAQF